MALSTTEAEYITLSTILPEVMALINFLEDLSNHGLPIHKATPRIWCNTFEDNMSCIQLATNHKTRLITKQINDFQIF